MIATWPSAHLKYLTSTPLYEMPFPKVNLLCGVAPTVYSPISRPDPVRPGPFLLDSGEILVAQGLQHSLVAS